MRLHLDSRVRRFDDGRVLLGGAPTRMLSLGATGKQLLDSWLAGDPVGPGRQERAFARRLLDANVVHPTARSGTTVSSDIALVVPVRNNAAGVERLLAATSGVGQRIVVDDASGTPIPDATIRHRRQRGPAAARNSGWRCAATPLTAFLDSDTVPATDWLNSIVPLFDDPSVAAVAPRVVPMITGWIGRYETHRSAHDMGTEPAAVRPDGPVRYVPGAALVVRTEVLRAVGGFDESLRFGEDVDLIWRLLAAGYTVRYQPQSTVRHEPRNTLAAFAIQRFEYGTSAAPLARRHPHLLHAAHIPTVALVQGALALRGHTAAATLPSVLASARTLRHLRVRQVPLSTATILAARTQFALIRQLTDALLRVWWPVALCSRRGRSLLRLACAATAVEAVVTGEDVIVRLADNAAYGLGVWTGCLWHRTIEPLTPRFHRTGRWL